MQTPIETKDFKVSSSVQETASEDGAVLLDTEQGICFSLNPVGLRIWQMLKDGYAIAQMADVLEKEFHAPRADLLADVAGFIDSLRAKRLLRPRVPENHMQTWLWWPFFRRKQSGPLE